MQDTQNSNYSLYRQALVNPLSLSEADLLQLIAIYPFSQPLVFAYEYYKKHNNVGSFNKSQALLYASNQNWLYTFLNQDFLVESDQIFVDSVPVDEDLSSSSVEESAHSSVSEENCLIISDEELDTINANKEQDLISDNAIEELDFLARQGGVSADYFVFEKNEDGVNKVVSEAPSAHIVDEDDISLYNDEMMPYSFRWWLHKTRIEHSDTYQPFAVVDSPISKRQFVDFDKLEVAILDQQIKENIIHFQTPEEKLSEQVKNRPVEPSKPKSSDVIIDKFIREEPVIQPPTAEKLNAENMARQSAEDNFVLVTETLANVYVTQGLLQKAIDVFDKLILKYPEKKSYFANRIKELKKNL